MTDEEDDLVLVFNPPLAALLTRAEELKGAPLTEAEVLRIRDGGRCTAIPQSVATKLVAERGYRDLDPHHAWEDWQALRKTK